MWSLRARLTLSYVLVALLCLLLVFALANGILESEFRRYVRDSQEESSRQLVDLIGRQLRSDGTWNEAGLEAVGMSALEQGMIVRVRGADGQTVWDALVHNNGMCQQMITHMAANMTSRYPNWQGSLTEAPFPLVKGTVSIGSVTIATWGPFFLNDEDLAFITTLNRLLLWVTLAVLAVAVVVGLVMARGISVPLARVAAATQSIAAGNLDVRIGEKTRVREIAALTTAVNGLSRGLREQEALRRRLTADVAHELRTPLAALQSHLEALIDGVWQPDSHRLGSLHEEILRINRLVQDLESLARQESGAADLNRRPADLSRLVQAVVTNSEPQFRSRGISMRFVGGAESVPAEVDPDKVSQALLNLVSNALEFTPAGGSVSVSVSSRSGSAEIAVSDTGIGIAPEDLPRVFERLYRADPSRSRSTGGAGIGLSIARAIIEAHGGSIRAESQPGKGSVFTIVLPLPRAAAEAASGA